MLPSVRTQRAFGSCSTRPTIQASLIVVSLPRWFPRPHAPSFRCCRRAGRVGTAHLESCRLLRAVGSPRPRQVPHAWVGHRAFVAQRCRPRAHIGTRSLGHHAPIRRILLKYNILAGGFRHWRYPDRPRILEVHKYYSSPPRRTRAPYASSH